MKHNIKLNMSEKDRFTDWDFIQEDIFFGNHCFRQLPQAQPRQPWMPAATPGFTTVVGNTGGLLRPSHCGNGC